MAYEISEGAAAGALFLSEPMLNSMKVIGADKEAIMSVMTQLHINLKDSTKVEMGTSASRYKTWFDPKNINLPKDKAFGKNMDAKLTAVVQGCSAALGIRKFMKAEGDIWKNTGVKVYVTGAAWHADISFLQMTVNKWKDYNSSDLVVVKGKCYYGVSLKKKEKETSADPTMINKSFVKLMESDKKMKTFVGSFMEARALYFGKLVKSEITGSVGALKGTIGAGSDEVLFYSKVKNPFSKGWTFLINLKGEGKLNLENGRSYSKEGQTGKQYEATAKEGFIFDPEINDWVVNANEEDYKNNKAVRELFGFIPEGPPGTLKTQTAWKMRQNINSEVSKIKEPGNIMYTIQGIAEDKKVNGVNFAETIGEYLISAVLKTELKGANSKLKGEMEGGKHFGFALITALGAVKTNTKKETKITAAGSTALVKTNATMQQTLSSLNNGKWKIAIAENPTKKDINEQAKDKEESAPAKIFFDIGVTELKKYTDVLKLNIRYKGDFVSSPQFQGGMSDAFIALLKTKSKAIENEFTKACG